MTSLSILVIYSLLVILGLPSLTNTEPGQQARVDWTSLGYLGVEGRQPCLYVFVMTLGYSHILYVGFTMSTEVANTVMQKTGFLRVYSLSRLETLGRTS
jgi:hypothetical protein